jgi:hypothetical protein
VSRTIVIFWLLAVVFFPSPERKRTFAQEPVLDKPTECAFDSFGNIRAEDRAARLDNFAIQLQYQPEAYGYVVVFAPESASKRIGRDITNYLMRSWRLTRGKVKTYHAGYSDPITDLNVQLWVVPKGAELPARPPKRKVDLARFNGMLAEYEKSDYIQLAHPLADEEWEPEEPGPPVGNVTYAAFDDVLKAQKHSVGHVVVFNGVEDVPGTWRRAAKSTVEDLKRFGFASSRFKIAYGGQSQETRVQLWILPPGEMPPVKDPASEPQPPKALQIGEFTQPTLTYANNEPAVFNRLLTVLRENPGLRACLIVRREESADLSKLARKWKSKLTAKYRIPAARVVILSANAQESHMASIEVWVVPQGQSLPDIDQ